MKTTKDILQKYIDKYFGGLSPFTGIEQEKIYDAMEEYAKLKVGQMEPRVKQAACGKWQRKKPDKPCYFIHRYNKKDRYPSLFEADIDTDVLCVYNIQDDEFVETMEGFADGQFFIIEK